MTTAVIENVTSRLMAASEIHVPEPYEPDNHTAKANLAGLTVSIIALGMLEPIRVRRDGHRHVLLDGAKRLRACADAGVVQVPTLVVQTD
jgi:ParB family chromosome partitioning protein